MNASRRISISATFLWIGFVCAISFMEAWLKFQAPGIDTKLGLGIGRLVFGALNKVEWVLALAIAISHIMNTKMVSVRTIFYIIPAIILIAQTFYILPQLDARAEMIIQNQPLPDSNLHLVSVIAEIVKVISLVIFGINQFEKDKT
ncbi:hypothetical protein [Salibacter halophilus]|uniref:DUF4149 domain-containing protein n=1 Tax=Salibacter halophilus TaxID=1803916 RepID=A0A6N6MB20_9FLAO|nr:hypothetical protein [Salibacter halophilus]KAB1064426.1 hypothetical protein F3059_06925 [Salibacter halophilus]